MLYTNIRDLAIALTDTARNFDTQVAFLLGEEIDEEAIRLSSFKPASIVISEKKEAKKPEKAVTTAPVELKEASVEDYIKEIDALRAKNSKLEQQNQALRDDLRSYRKKAKSADSIISKYESSRYIAGEFGSYDRVYFFTGFISHKDYYRYVATLRKDNVSFGYMNGEVNIEKNIVQIYNDIMEGEQ